MMDQGKGLEQARCLMDQYWAATLALRQRAGSEEVHAYRIATRRLLALLALWRPLIHEPGLERRLMRAAGRLSALRDAQVYAAHFGVLGIFRPKTTKCSGGHAVRGLQRGITFLALHIASHNKSIT